MTTWTFSINSILESAGVPAEEINVLASLQADIAQAFLLINLDHQKEIITPTDSSRLHSSAPLLIPGTLYHINLSETAKATAKTFIRIITSALLLHQTGLMAIAVPVSVFGIQTILEQLSRLSHDQAEIVDSILRLRKSENNLLYWPTAGEISRDMNIEESEILRILRSIPTTVVKYVENDDSWRVYL